jgi:hypothetical protein
VVPRVAIEETWATMFGLALAVEEVIGIVDRIFRRAGHPHEVSLEGEEWRVFCLEGTLAMMAARIEEKSYLFSSETRGPVLEGP